MICARCGKTLTHQNRIRVDLRDHSLWYRFVCLPCHEAILDERDGD